MTLDILDNSLAQCLGIILTIVICAADIFLILKSHDVLLHARKHPVGRALCLGFLLYLMTLNYEHVFQSGAFLLLFGWMIVLYGDFSVYRKSKREG